MHAGNPVGPTMTVEVHTPDAGTAQGRLPIGRHVAGRSEPERAILDILDTFERVRLAR